MITNDISVVIGSWGSYNECNERALGSEWLNLSDYTDWDEIVAELTKQGFILDGIDEELFIQDIEGLPSNSANWDFVSPKKLFETLKESGVLEDNHKYNVMQAYIEVRCFNDFENLVESRGENWDDDIHIYEDFDWDDYGQIMFECLGHSIDDHLLGYFDFEAYGESFSYDCAEKYSGGIIEIYR